MKIIASLEAGLILKISNSWWAQVLTSQNKSQPKKHPVTIGLLIGARGFHEACGHHVSAPSDAQPCSLTACDAILPTLPSRLLSGSGTVMRPLLCEVLHVHGSAPATAPCASLPHPVTCIRICSHAFLPPHPPPPEGIPHFSPRFSSPCSASTRHRARPRYSLSECRLDGRVIDRR